MSGDDEGGAERAETGRDTEGDEDRRRCTRETCE